MYASWSMFPYDRPLPRPIVTAHGVYRLRSGLLLQAHDGDGFAGLGDSSPLPGFSSETREDVQRRWEAIRAQVEQAPVPQTRDELAGLSSTLERWTDGLPSLRFALETALADLSARRAGIPLARWLAPQSADRVEVNALLSAIDADSLRAQARAAVRSGYHTFKIKAAVGPVPRDVERTMAVRNEVPTAAIRIDANGGWTPSQASHAFASLRDAALEFIEQPFPIGFASQAHALSQEFGIPLALDEEAGSVDAALWLIREHLCDVVVTKPMIIGGLVNAMRLADTARQVGIRVTFTSSWESDVGLAATLHLAAAVGPTVGACGLSTAGMIAEELVEPALRIDNGYLAIEGHHGLGLTLCPPQRENAGNFPKP